MKKQAKRERKQASSKKQKPASPGPQGRRRERPARSGGCLSHRRHRRFRRGTGGPGTIPESCAGRQRHGLRHRSAPGPDPQGHHGGTAAARHRHEGHPGQGPDAGPAELRLCHSAQQRHVHSARRPAPARSGGRRAGLRLPIDFFFRSLADDRQEQSIGVILSGMGTDGTLGLRAIKEKAGVVFVQEPASAKFDGMPRSAIDAGLADVVAPVEELPGKIIAYLQHTLFITQPELPLEDKAQSGLEKVVILLRAQTGHDFSLYKKNTIYRRIERRMGLHQIDRIATYVRFLQENPQELDLLFKELLIGVTSFFRDPAAWEQSEGRGHPGAPGQPLRQQRCGPGCPAARPGRKPIPWPSSSKRRWSRSSRPGAFRSRSSPPTWTGRHRQGAPGPFSRPTSPRMSRRNACAGSSSRKRHGYRVGKEIREMVIFAPQNLIMDPPFTKLDMLDLPEPADLPDAGTAEEAPAALSLQPESRRHPVSGERRDHRRLHRPLRPAGRQGAALPAARVVPAGEPVEFPSAFSACRAGRAGRRRRRQPAANLQIAGGSTAPAALLPGGRPGQRPGRHPLHQRTDGQIPGAGRRQGQLEYLRHGPRGAALRAEQCLPEGAPAKGTPDPAQEPAWSAPMAAPRPWTSPFRRIAEPEALRGTAADRLYRRGPRRPEAKPRANPRRNPAAAR